MSYYDFCEQSSETELLHEGSALCQNGFSLAYIPSGGVSQFVLYYKLNLGNQNTKIAL